MPGIPEEDQRSPSCRFCAEPRMTTEYRRGRALSARPRGVNRRANLRSAAGLGSPCRFSKPHHLLGALIVQP